MFGFNDKEEQWMLYCLTSARQDRSGTALVTMTMGRLGFLAPEEGEQNQDMNGLPGSWEQDLKDQSSWPNQLLLV